MQNFASLFIGRDDVHGAYTIPAGSKPSAKGKLAGMATTKRSPVTAATYEAHLKGEKRLGVVPIRPVTNDVMWFALDVDEYKSPDLHKKLMTRINKLALPLVMTRSKSGGAHLWSFFQKPVAASKAREIAQSYIQKLGLKAETEIFPKQETIREEDDGSWINLPYFGETCKAVGEDGTTELTLTQFLQFADDRIVDRANVGRNEIVGPTDPSDGGAAEGMPPCIATMLVEGIEEGGRDSALTHIAVYLIKAHPDDWEEKLAQINDDFVHPPLEMSQLGKIGKSLKNKNYQYLCKQSPMASLCNKPVCLQRKFGIGGGEASTGVAVLIDSLEKINGEEPIYRVTMYGKTFTVDATTLFRYNLFQIAAMKTINRVLPPMKNNDWNASLNEQLATMTYIDPPLDTQMAERIVGRFKEWINQSAQQSSPDAIVLHGIPYFDGRSLYFRGNDFMNMIDKQFKVSRDQVWLYLSKWGVDHNKIELTIGGKKVPLWRYEIDQQDGQWFEMGKAGAF